MNSGLEKTLALLAATNNEAATKLLLEGLDSTDREVQSGSLRALVQRRSPAGHAELLRRWDTLSERHKAAIAEQSSRMSGALRDAILGADKSLADKGLDAVLRLREHDLVSTLITAAEDKSNDRAAAAAKVVLGLCEMLHEEVVAPRDYAQRRDPQATRKYISSSLEESVRRFDQHKRPEILEAFLLLTSYSNGLLRQILHNPHGKAYLQTVSLLAKSTRPGIQDLLVSFLDDPQCPTAIHAILSRRRDIPFLRRLFTRFASDSSKPLLKNARRIESFSWIKEAGKILQAISAGEQCGILHLVIAAGINRLEAFEIVRLTIEQGGDEARRAASKALEGFHGAESNQLVLACLQDSDANVRANVVPQLRDRGIPGAMQQLLELINSPDDVVREAARDSLSEFNFERLLGSFDLLSADVAQSTAQLVKKIDREAIQKLAAEFESPSRTRRLRALAVAVTMHAVRDVEREVITMLSDSDHFIRVEAARAMAQCDTPAARQAIRELLVDRTASVKEAAEQTLQSFAEANGPIPAPCELDDASANLMQFTRESLQ